MRFTVCTEMEDDAMSFVQLADEAADLGPMTVSSGTWSGATTCTASPRVRKRGCDFEADEARADDYGLLRRCRFRHDRLAVGERAQIEDLRRRSALDRQLDRIGAGGEQQSSVFVRLTVFRGDLRFASCPARSPAY